MADKPKSSIEKLNEQYDTVDEIVDTAEQAHDAAYVKAVDTLIRDKKTGRVKRSLLKDEKVQLEFAKIMGDHILNETNRHFQTKYEGGKNPIESSQLMNAFSKVTYKELNDRVRSYGHKYTSKAHAAEKEESLQKIRQEITPYASAHLGEKDKSGLVKAMNADKFLDPEKATLNQLLGDYNVWRQSGKTMSEESLRDMYRQRGLPVPVYVKSTKSEKGGYTKAA